MIYFCADDYGLDERVSMRIQQCVDRGVLNRVSVFPNFDAVDLNRITQNRNIRLSLHLNLVEGTCMADPQQIPLLADHNGRFRHTFGGLLKASVLHKKAFEAQVYQELKAQILFWKTKIKDERPLCVDSHQHTHMIPAVFRMLLKVLREEHLKPTHMRIPAEPLLPYIQTPSLYFTYHPVNLAKQWILKFFWLINRPQAREQRIPVSYFIGILFSGKMDEKRVSAVLPKYIKLAQKKEQDIEVLFHPGYLEEKEPNFKNENIVFKHFYISQNRKTEFDSAMKLSERSVR